MWIKKEDNSSYSFSNNGCPKNNEGINLEGWIECSEKEYLDMTKNQKIDNREKELRNTKISLQMRILAGESLGLDMKEEQNILNKLMKK